MATPIRARTMQITVAVFTGLWLLLMALVAYIHDSDLERMGKIEDELRRVAARLDVAEGGRIRNDVTLEFLKKGQARILEKLETLEKKMTERG